jgi:hypothetical protein
VQPARWLFFVVVASKTVHRAHVALLIRGSQDIFLTPRPRADAVVDADGRDEASDVRTALPRDSKHVSDADLACAGSRDRSRRGRLRRDGAVVAGATPDVNSGRSVEGITTPLGAPTA